jgi:outer membrane protein assembly factor BamB
MPEPDQAITLDEVLFVGFNRRVAALSKHTGEIFWTWKAPKGHGFVSLLVEDDRVYVSVSGYVYCLDAATGQQLWHNPMAGFGIGVTCLASPMGHSPHALLAEAQAEHQRRAAATGPLP